MSYCEVGLPSVCKFGLNIKVLLRSSLSFSLINLSCAFISRNLLLCSFICSFNSAYESYASMKLFLNLSFSISSFNLSLLFRSYSSFFIYRIQSYPTNCLSLSYSAEYNFMMSLLCWVGCFSSDSYVSTIFECFSMIICGRSLR